MMEELPTRTCNGPLYSGHDEAYVALAAVGLFLLVVWLIMVIVTCCKLGKAKDRKVFFCFLFFLSFIILCTGAIFLAGGIWHLGNMRRYKKGGCDDLIRVNLRSADITTTPENLTIAFVGDTGVTSNTLDVYRLIKKLLVHVGDFDYCDDPTLFHRQLDTILGDDFPIIAVVGNHDIHLWGDYQEMWLEHFNQHTVGTPSKYLSCEGFLGVNYYCVYRGLFFAFSSVGTMCGDGYDDYKYHEEELQKNLDARSKLSETPWTMCAWHKNQRLLQTGNKKDETGYGVYEICRGASGLVITGHNHQYSRTHTISNMETQTVKQKCEVEIDGDCVYNLTDVSIVTVSGLGGRDPRAFDPELETLAQWASKYNENYGVMFCQYNYKGNKDMVYCYFKDVTGKIHDAYKINRT